ncbi:uncharacterized protein B0T15DRAFT_120677 [Chaetomium strumarium]|uniref:Uncharacterized protein n=1 Tax=Chaetomium strumarium TaxID=1170767 RepID=A0AAJ0GZ52_9PEZI|nr:hypothetical protein B0T15DRAFT_120677 [Chaetomium strumarium]
MAASGVFSTLCREVLAKRTETSRLSHVCSSASVLQAGRQFTIACESERRLLRKLSSGVVIRNRLPPASHSSFGFLSVAPSRFSRLESVMASPYPGCSCSPIRRIRLAAAGVCHHPVVVRSSVFPPAPLVGPLFRHPLEPATRKPCLTCYAAGVLLVHFSSCIPSHRPVASQLFHHNHPRHTPARFITPSNSSFLTPFPTPAPPFASNIISLNTSSVTTSPSFPPPSCRPAASNLSNAATRFRWASVMAGASGVPAKSAYASSSSAWCASSDAAWRRVCSCNAQIPRKAG